MVQKCLALVLAVLLLLASVSCTNKPPQEPQPQLTRYEAEFLQLFDTMTQIVAYMETEEEFTQFAQSIHDSLEEYHQLFDIYNEYEGIHNLKTINDNAGVAPVKVDQKIIDLLLFSQNIYEQTSGICNIALGSVLKIWHDYRTQGIDNPLDAKLPPMEQLQEAAAHTNIEDVVIDTKASTVYLADPKMSLDVGGVAKGYATEQACKEAIEKGYTSGLVSVGGNVRAIGQKNPKGDLWNVGVQNPDRTSENSMVLITNLDNQSLVTSGIYQRYYVVDGVEYHHIIDPKTLMPARSFQSVSIVCEDSGMADGLTTAIFNMPLEEGIAFIDSLPDTEALWILPDGSLRYSANFENFVQKPAA